MSLDNGAQKNIHWEANVDTNKNASFIYIEENLQCEDLMKIVPEDFSIKEKEISLSYRILLDLKSIVEGFFVVSMENTRQLRSFIST